MNTYVSRCNEIPLSLNEAFFSGSMGIGSMACSRKSRSDVLISISYKKWNKLAQNTNLSIYHDNIKNDSLPIIINYDIMYLKKNWWLMIKNN